MEKESYFETWLRVAENISLHLAKLLEQPMPDDPTGNIPEHPAIVWFMCLTDDVDMRLWRNTAGFLARATADLRDRWHQVPSSIWRASLFALLQVYLNAVLLEVAPDDPVAYINMRWGPYERARMTRSSLKMR